MGVNIDSMAKKRKYRLAQNGLERMEGTLQGRNIGFEDLIPTGSIKKGPSALVPAKGKTNPQQYWDVFNMLAQLTTGVANQFTEAGNRKDETQQYLRALQQPEDFNFNEEGYGDVPIYYQHGGYNKYSVVDWLRRENEDSGFNSRQGLFQEAFGKKEKYTGAAEQNLRLLKALQSGWSPVSDVQGENVKNVPRPYKESKAMPGKAQIDARNELFNKTFQPFFDPIGAMVQTNGKAMIEHAKNAKKDDRLQSGVIVDKRKGEAYIIQNGKKVAVHPVLTGTNPDANRNDYSFDQLEADPSLRGATPVGNYFMSPAANVYGYPGFNMNPIAGRNVPAPAAEALAVHKTYDPAYREQFYKKPANERYKSWGCINCQKPTLDNFLQNFPQGDTLQVIDSKLPQYKDTMKQYQMGGQPAQPILAEAGEVYQDVEGALNKIPDSADRHEDPSGGVVIPDAQRVLEDTSTSRKDPLSKALKLKADQAEALIGVKAKGNLSHAKAMEKASKQLKNQVNRFESKLRKNVEDLQKRPHDKYAQASMKFNLQNISNLPSEGEMFDTLFEHQEAVKAMAGGVPQDKAQYGYPNGDVVPLSAKDSRRMANAAPITEDGGWQFPSWSLWPGDKGKAFSSRYNMNNAARHLPDLDTIAMSLGYDGPKDAKSLQQWIYNSSPQARAIVDKYHQEFGKPLGGMFDGKIGARWQMALQEILRQTPQQRTDLNFNLAPTGTGVGQTPLPEAPAAGTPEASRFNFKQQPKSEFNEPLQWYDVAGPIQGILEGRELNRYNPVQFNKIRMHQQNPLPQLQQGQRDFNAALSQLSNDGQGAANTANLFGRKYAMNNQILGQYENINKGILDKQDMYNNEIDMKQGLADQQAREVFERKVLGSREALRRQHLTSWNDLYTRLAQNRALNRNANIAMKLFPAFDQNLDWNGYQAQIREPLSMPNIGLLPGLNFGQNPPAPTPKYKTK